MSALTLFWSVVIDAISQRPSDWSFLRILSHVLVIWPWGFAHGSSSAVRQTSHSRSSWENLVLGTWQKVGEFSWGSIAGAGKAARAWAAGSGKLYGLVISGSVCIVEGGFDMLMFVCSVQRPGLHVLILEKLIQWYHWLMSVNAQSTRTNGACRRSNGRTRSRSWSWSWSGWILTTVGPLMSTTAKQGHKWMSTVC